MKSWTFGLGFSRSKLIQTNFLIDCDRRQTYYELNPFTLDRGVLNKVLYREVPPQGPTPCPLKYYFDRKGSSSVILILIRFVLSAKGIFHHGGCEIVQVLVLRYNQGANVKWTKIVIIKSSRVNVFKNGSRRPFWKPRLTAFQWHNLVKISGLWLYVQ